MVSCGSEKTRFIDWQM